LPFFSLTEIFKGLSTLIVFGECNTNLYLLPQDVKKMTIKMAIKE